MYVSSPWRRSFRRHYDSHGSHGSEKVFHYSFIQRIKHLTALAHAASPSVVVDTSLSTTIKKPSAAIEPANISISIGSVAERNLLVALFGHQDVLIKSAPCSQANRARLYGSRGPRRAAHAGQLKRILWMGREERRTL